MSTLSLLQRLHKSSAKYKKLYTQMIQMYYLTNFKVLQHFHPEIHLEILPPVGIRIILLGSW